MSKGESTWRVRRARKMEPDEDENGFRMEEGRKKRKEEKYWWQKRAQAEVEKKGPQVT